MLQDQAKELSQKDRTKLKLSLDRGGISSIQGKNDVETKPGSRNTPAVTDIPALLNKYVTLEAVKKAINTPRGNLSKLARDQTLNSLVQAEI